MKWIVQWAMPIAFVGIGLAIGFGWMLKQIPEGTGLRPVFAAVIVLIGVHRYFASRMQTRRDERRFGGGRPRPWEE